ncbi:adenylate kinase [Blyttiomyces sp. JEL0837]|nr:adenylate kinase [Blyttiomyces sp. JEL0837]
MLCSKLKNYSIKLYRTGTPELNVEQVVRIRDDEYLNEIKTVRSVYDTRYANLMILDATRSKWALKNVLKTVLETGTMRRQTYVDLRTRGRAAPVGNIGISLPHLSRNMGKYGEYSPVALVDRGELVKGPSDTLYTAEYQNRYYRMASQFELDAFLGAPERYAYGPDLPENLPERRSPSVLTFPKTLELQGYCPVTYAEGPSGFQSIVPGSTEFLVEYESRFFAMNSAEKLEQFMKTPWKYVNLELPPKLPPRLMPIPVGQLPLIGYLEQSVARIVIQALEAVGKVRPKHPNKDLSISASEYLALYFKAHNPHSKEWVRQSYQKRLKRYEGQCDLIKEISSYTSGISNFITAQNRPPGLDQTMDEFFTLRVLQ